MKKTIVFAFFVFTAFAGRAQFKDSSRVLLHDLGIKYELSKLYESDFQGIPGATQNQKTPLIHLQYALAFGRYKNGRLFFYGLTFGYGINYDRPYRSPVDSRRDTTSWNIGVLAGKRYYLKLANRFYLTPGGFLYASYGKERLDIVASAVPFPTEYDLNVYTAGVAFQPLRVGYQVGKRSLLELNLMETGLHYVKKSGSRRGTTNEIDLSSLSFQNRFLSRVQISFTHSL